MSWVEFITAFAIDRFELRILGYEVHVSPTLIEALDESLAVAFESHYKGLTRILDGFHLVEHDKVSLFSCCDVFIFLHVFFRFVWACLVYVMY